MEKLIELLTEHCRKHYWFKDNDDIEIDTDSIQFHLYHNAKRYFSIGVEKVISKEFWFISRLVDNDKIDFRKVIEKEIEIWFKLMRIKDYPKKIKEEDVEEVLMLLAIQDKPIDFLISILK